ncbi:p-aminobenzoyl-glutamate transporter AbgT [Pseudarthrobacter sp. PvP004]|jgi:p-aminobenzoyl-glutamate transporter AbgT|nr:p-aminobenzoyl-glutamate transporter AbgT [Pseudarthrobacter sp. PvP004]
MGTTVVVVTILWLVLGQFIGPKLQARRTEVQNPEA